MNPKPIIFYCIFILIALNSFAQKSKEPFISNLKISECKGSCPTNGAVKFQKFEDGVLNLSFGILLNCCFGDTFVMRLNSDTLFLQAESKENLKKLAEAKKKGEKNVNQIGSHCTCDCFFEVELEIVNLTYKSKYFMLGNYIHDSIDGFVSYDDYVKLSKVTRSNNSDKLIGIEFEKLLNESLNSSSILKMFHLLGEDSLSYSYEDRIEVDYKYDGVYLKFDSKAKLNRITLSENFKGELPGNIHYGIGKKDSGLLLGKPSKEDELIVLENYGEDASEGLERMTVWFYTNRKLRLMFDSKDKLVEVAFLRM